MTNKSLARYTDEFANRIETLADTMNTRNIDERGTDAASRKESKRYRIAGIRSELDALLSPPSWSIEK